EIGTLQPITEIGMIARKYNIIFHTDACQAGNQELNVDKLLVDLMTLNGSKIYGPKGTGILYKKKGIKICSLIHGGGQEFGLRSGTENLPGIAGFAKALELIQAEKVDQNQRLTTLRDYFIKKVLQGIPRSLLNGHPQKRLPNNVNISFYGVEGESILLYLNKKGIYVSTGSACSSQKIEISPVLRAIGLPESYAQGSIRFTLGRNNSRKDIDFTVSCLKNILKSLRMLS
ncbi:aminotransferase class V-fold PLP-dependent enzyme, partial [Candidatus Woesearchaeota archaeon]|nr:aminotransferase class V-fold PLP-dependent enzyme [Candidatus Woesearchaeota archaeon]